MKILFLHGWHSVVGGVKPTFLKDAGHQVINPKLDDDDFDQALQMAQEEFDRHTPDVVVGSSRGGAVAMNIKSGSTPLVLLCPAWKNWGVVHLLKQNALILHSREDDVIPFEHSELLVAQSGLPTETLIEVGSDHRLADESSLAVMLWACSLLAAGKQIPALENSESNDSTGLPMDAQSTSQEEGSYICDACGETIVVPLDLTEGSHQSYVEDCPVCCRANTIHVQVDEDGLITVWAEPEQEV
jgi:Cysteine-rich CPXCG